MSFLAPMFLIGAAAIALPIVFHLIRRTTRERMPFSSLMFLAPTPPRVTRQSRLENIFLLILRCLVLCLLALGFARPFFKKPQPTNRQSDNGKKIVLLLDTSASMRRGNLWPMARAKAEEILGNVTPSDQVAVFTFDRQARQLVGFEQWASMNPGERVSLTAQRIKEISPGWYATHLGTAIITAAETFDEKANQQQTFGPRQIVLISDLQEGSHLEELQGYEWPRGIELIIEPIKAKRTTNSGLQFVMDADESTQPNTETSARIRVLNSADAQREQFQIRWEGVSGTDPMDVYVPPGQGRIFQSPKLDPGVIGERLILTGDDEDFDNKVYLLQTKADNISVLYLGNEMENDPAQPLYYLRRAFQQTRRQVVQIIPRRVDAPFTAAEIQTAHFMIVTESLPEEQIKTVEQFLKDGKTVLFSMKESSAAQTIARLTGSQNFTAEEAPAARYAMLGEISFEHPLFMPFADPRFSDFTKIHFWKHRRINTDKIAGARILARFDSDSSTALVEIPVGKGALLVLSSGWHPADSQLALSSKFVPLLYAMLEQSGGLKSQRSQYWVGDEVTLNSTNSPATFSISKPDGSTLVLAKGEKFGQTDLPGIYTVTSEEAPFRFAVNLDPAESKTAPMPIEELERFGVPLKKERLIETAKQREQKQEQLLAAELEKQQQLWRWLIVATLLILIAETWLAGSLTRRGAVAAAQA